jgi:hypothetical protein
MAERLALKAMAWLKPLIPANYQPIAAKRVALALQTALAHNMPGVTRLQSGQMQSP